MFACSRHMRQGEYSECATQHRHRSHACRPPPARLLANSAEAGRSRSRVGRIGPRCASEALATCAGELATSPEKLPSRGVRAHSRHGRVQCARVAPRDETKRSEEATGRPRLEACGARRPDRWGSRILGWHGIMATDASLHALRRCAGASGIADGTTEPKLRSVRSTVAVRGTGPAWVRTCEVRCGMFRDCFFSLLMLVDIRSGLEIRKQRPTCQTVC